MKTPTIRVSLAFGNSMPDDALITFSRSVHSLLYGAAGFTTVPVTATVLEAATDAFSNAKAAQTNGGKAATAEKNNKREELVKMLKQLAYYVQITSDDDLAMVLSTGFEPVSTNRAQSPLAKPSIDRLVPGMQGTMLATVTREKAARGCEIRVAQVGSDGAPGEFRAPFFSGTTRNVKVENLVPGALFALQARAMGGSTGSSDWSDVIIQRAA